MSAVTIRNYGAIASIEELADFTERVTKAGTAISFDIETGYHGDDREKGAIHRSTAIVVGISFTNSLDWARYVPLAHDTGENLDNYRAAQLFWDMFSTGLGVAHNAGFELRHLSKWFLQELSADPDRGEQVRASNGYFPIRSDSMVEAYLAADYPSFGLKYLTKEMFGHVQTELHELFGPEFLVKNRKFIRFNTLELTPQVVNYACEDSVWCLAIHHRYFEQLNDRLLFTVEKSIVQDVLPFMEDEGVLYDWTLMRRTADSLRDFRDRFNAEIMDELSYMTGAPVAINLASPPQVRKSLYDSLGMRTSVYTDKTRDLPMDQRVMSTSDLALRKLADKFPVVKKILQWREQTKLLGTYLDKYERVYNIAEDGRAHPSHLSAFVITGRFAHSDPNYAQCLPGSYEVLTPTGWERLDKLADGTSVAQYANNQSISFTVPSAVIRQPYDGDMVEIEAGRAGRWRYTPNHRIVYRTRGSRGDRILSDIKELTAEEWEKQLAPRPVTLPFGRHFNDRHIPCAGWTTRPGYLTDKWVENLRLAVAVQADGSRTNGYQYDICVYKERKVEALRGLGLEPQQFPDGRWRVRVPVDSVRSWLDETKNFRADTILSLHQDDLDVFLQEVMFWDGDSKGGRRYGQKTSRRQSVDVVQAAAALMGQATSLYEDPAADHVTVNVHPRGHRDSGYQVIKRVPSDGMVYCVTVPTGMFLVRNDEGHVQVTGNSPKKYHFDLTEAMAAHAAGEEPPPGTCFRFNFRDVIKAPEDCYILGFDLSQAELRAIAGEAQEHALLEAFENGDDVHRVTASLMLGVPLDEVTEEQRAIGKMLNFALLYGMSAKGLADRLNIALEEAESLMDKYFAGLSAIATYMTKMVRAGKQKGYVTSKFGRKMPIWEYLSDNPYIRSKGDRACVNYPIQGAATGDYMKIAMVRVVHAIKKAGLADKVKLVMNVHDALEFYVHKSLTPEQVIAVLKPAVVFDVPGWPAMKADWHIAKRWGSPTEIIVHDDGTISAKGAKVDEIVPSIEVDEEGNEIVALPEVDEQTLHEAASGPGRQVVVTLDSMPTMDTYRAFRAFLESLPGRNAITLVTPEGELELSTTSGLAPAHLGAVNQLLPGAKVGYLAEHYEQLAVGLGL